MNSPGVMLNSLDYKERYERNSEKHTHEETYD